GGEVHVALEVPEDLAGTGFVVRGALLQGDTILGHVEAWSGSWPSGSNQGARLRGAVAGADRVTLIAVHRPSEPPAPEPVWKVEATDPDAA
ncbi:MAG: hypothetical protein KDD11_17050, partial [Acidobacteria bacterium]|nr:hypothetical protein [Acidobacteriota bacterium]